MNTFLNSSAGLMLGKKDDLSNLCDLQTMLFYDDKIKILLP